MNLRCCWRIFLHKNDESKFFLYRNFLTLFSCGQNEKRKAIEVDSQEIEWEIDSSNIVQKSLEKEQKSNPTKSTSDDDSLRNPYHYAYLTDLSYPEIGRLILQNKAKPMDNHITFVLMDTISNCDVEYLGFYLGVFENIMDKSDGALSEAVGLYTLKFIKNRTEIFTEHIDTANTKNISNWGKYSAFEMYFDYTQDSLVYYCKELVNELKQITNNKGVLHFENAIISSAKSFRD